HSSGGDRGFGHDEGQLVAQLHTETASDQLTDDDAELPLAQILEAARLHVIAEDRHPLFGLGIDPRCQYRCDAAVMGQHALHLDEGRDPDYLRVLLQLRGKAAPVVDRLKPLMLAWGTMPRMRVRSSRSKPFMTDSTRIITSTPSVSPSMDISEMKEM